MKNLVYAFFLLSFFSCKEEEVQKKLVDFTPVRVTYISYATDGCGFFVEVKEQIFKPINEEVFPESFKPKDTIVQMKYFDLKKKVELACGFVNSRPSEKAIEVLEYKPIPF